MNKIHKERQIYALIDGRLNENKKKSLEKHLNECENCRLFLENIQNIRKELKIISVYPQNAVDFDKIEENIKNKIKLSSVAIQKSASWLFFYKIAFTSSLLLLFFSLYILADGYIEELQDKKTCSSLSPQDTGKKIKDSTAKNKYTDEITGYFTLISGNISLKNGDRNIVFPDISTQVTSGTEIETPLDGHAVIQFGDTAAVRVERNSLIKLDKLTKSETIISLKRGTTLVDFFSSSGKSHFSVITSELKATVAGTLFSVSKHENLSQIVVKRGKVEIVPLISVPALNKKPEGKRMFVQTGEGFRIDKNGNIYNVKPLHLKQEQERLENTNINSFKANIPETVVSVNIDDSGEFEYFEIDGKRVEPVSFIIRTNSNKFLIDAVLKNGNKIPLSYPVEQNKKMEISLDGSIIAKEVKEIVAQLHSSTKEGKKISRIQTAEIEAPATKEEKYEEEKEPAEQYAQIDSYLVKTHVLKEKGLMRSCYEKYLSSEPEEKIVKAKISFTIGTSGRVIDARCELNVENDELKKCLENVIKSIKLPAPEWGIAKWEYPITFKPE